MPPEPVAVTLSPATTLPSIVLCGVHVDDEDMKTLVDLLLRVGRADNLSAAATIEAGLAEGAGAVDLSEAGCTTVLGVPVARILREAWQTTRAPRHVDPAEKSFHGRRRSTS